MKYRSVDEAYNANDAIRSKLKETVLSFTAEQVDTLPAGEKWTIKQIVEHVSLVNEGVVRICAKLLSKAESANRLSSGEFVVSNSFVEKGVEVVDVKLEAPEFVHPVHGASIDDSFAKLDASMELAASLREKFQKFDGTEAKFPHPYFGDLSAHEWLVLSGAHEARHLKQIRNMIEKISH
ncbi:MAG: DinB family protein [Pyrinomonadaceae bacterium]|nr:DinB family protein [Blastocatellia bacterium]MCW5956325.1 DinB family protein [Pyrinomonadaceae bacterium]